jgi:hypothetical protein
LTKRFETKINALRDNGNQRTLKKEKTIWVFKRVVKVPDIMMFIIVRILAHNGIVSCCRSHIYVTVIWNNRRKKKIKTTFMCVLFFFFLSIFS